MPSNSIDPQKTKVIIPLAAVVSGAMLFGGAVWTLASMHGDMKGQLRRQEELFGLRLDQVDRSLETLGRKIDTLNGDHGAFVTKGELRHYSQSLKELNEGIGLRTPTVE